MMSKFHLFAAGLLVVSPLSAQSNATSELMTYGDVVGDSFRVEVSGLTPGVTTFVIPSFNTSGSNYLVGLSGDPNDHLTVGLQLAQNGTYFTTQSSAAGTATLSLAVPNNSALVDREVYIQAFTRPGGSGADMFDDFSHIRLVTVNLHNRWQATDSMPLPSALMGSCVLEVGAEGDAMVVFSCGGGPAVLVNTSTPYPTQDRCWTYDARTEQHTLLGGVMNDSRAFHTATRLQDGRVLISGGIQGPRGSGNSHYTDVLDSVEIYDPNADVWQLATPMQTPRAGATATLLADGRVLIAGGTKGNGQNQLGDVNDLLGTAVRTTEIYNPATDVWVSGPNLQEPKAGASSTTLQDGRVMIAGGLTHTYIFGIAIPAFSDTACFYNQATGGFDPKKTMITKRALFAMTLLNDGSVLLAGGGGGDIFNIGPIKQCEVFVPASSSFSSVDNLTTSSAFASCVSLKDGRALVVGGATGSIDDPLPIADCWVFEPSSGSMTSVSSLSVEHAGGAVFLMEDGTVYVGGGESGAGISVDASESWSP